ncbi:BnaC06g03320D [Brassica napus]|uniref:BnaC06g03320D protein n=1 Tax=Brassica napus TaxID=3708 RepID=A0A078HXV9_BRANA|nr:BnaC06g03320D [Brassica napus]
MVWATGDLNNTRQIDTFFMDDVATKLARREATNITWQRDSFVEEGKSAVMDFLVFNNKRW